MDDNDFEVFFQTLTVKDLKEIISEYKEVKGLSKYRKPDLIETFINLFSKEEQTEAYNKWMPIKLRDYIERSINVLTRWKNVQLTLDEDQDLYHIDITWQGGEEDRCTVSLEDEQVLHECNCKLGEKGGICVHLVSLVILLYLKGKIDLNQFPFPIEESWLHNVLNYKFEIIANVSNTDDADIDMDEYWLFIGDKTITAKWSGEYAGTSTVNIDELNKKLKKEAEEKVIEKAGKKGAKTKSVKYTPITVEEWVITKVVDKEMESLRKYGRVRDIVTDKYKVIEKIITNKKQIERLRSAFKRAAEKFGQDSYPETDEDIQEALRVGLIE